MPPPLLVTTMPICDSTEQGQPALLMLEPLGWPGGHGVRGRLHLTILHDSVTQSRTEFGSVF